MFSRLLGAVGVCVCAPPMNVYAAHSPCLSRTSLLCFIAFECLPLRGFETLSIRKLISEAYSFIKLKVNAGKSYSVEHIAREALNITTPNLGTLHSILLWP